MLSLPVGLPSCFRAPYISVVAPLLPPHRIHISVQVSNICYRLKLGNGFVEQNFKHQVRVIGESSERVLWPITPSVKHALLAEVC